MDNIGTLLAHNVWQSIIIFGIAFLILKLVKNVSAEEKSWSWSVTLFALALLPLAAFLPGKGIELETVQAPVVSSFEQSEVPEFAPTLKSTSKAKTKINMASPGGFSLPKFGKEDLLMAFMVIWLLGTGFSLLRLTYACFNALKLRDGAYPYAGPEDAHWPSNVEVAVSNSINGPIVIGVFKPLILIPRSFAFDMVQEELKPLLYHELAHIKRRDNLLHFVERIIIAFYWWNPIMHYIAARISEERELACDDRAASSCGDNLVYAKSLLKGARKLMGDNKPVLGLAVLRRESVLSKRIKRLTVRSAFEGLNAKRLVKNLSVLSMAVLLLSLVTPRIAISQDVIDKKELNSVEMMQDDYFLEVEWKGNIELDDMDTEIIDLSDDGYFSLVTDENGELRELIFSHDGEAMDSRFLVDGTEREMTPEDMTWQRHAMVNMLRLSGINAEKRVDRIYAEGGAEKVINEISKMHADYPTRLYTEALVEIYELEQGEIQSLIRIVDQMESDYEKRLALESIANEQDLDGDTVELLATAAEDIDDAFYTQTEFEHMSEQEIEEMKRDVERQLAELPTAEEMERIRQEALESLPSAEELEEMRREALESLPSEEELEAIRTNALASVPTVEELKEIHAQALAGLPSEEELEKIVKDAMKTIPTMEELEEIRREAMEGIPDAEEILKMHEDAIKNIPTAEMLEEIRKEIKENVITKEELEEIRRELREQLENLPENEQNAL